MKPNLEEALNHLPHGPEFRFLDRLIELSPGVEGSAEFTVRSGEYFLRGHFPGEPILPGVLLIEAAAQLAGVVAQSAPDQFPLRSLRLTALRQVKILGAVVPGQTVLLHARIVGRLGELISADAQAFVEDKLVLSANLSLSGTAAESAGKSTGT